MNALYFDAAWREVTALFLLCNILYYEKETGIFNIYNKITLCQTAHWLISSRVAVGAIREWLAWWRHQMEKFTEKLLTLWAGNSAVPGEFPIQRTVTRSFDVFFDLRLIKRLSKHSRRRWFKTPSRSLWRHRNGFCRLSHYDLVTR